MMVEKDYIDPENLFVTGGSGGGVLTIDDPLLLKYQFPGFPWDHVDHYEKRNLLSVVKNVKTPTMLITGDQDYRVRSGKPSSTTEPSSC